MLFSRVFHFNDEDEQAERCLKRAIELEPENNKNYHDKIEFNVVETCYSLNSKKRLQLPTIFKIKRQ